jgi:hypothetical protein
MDPVIAGDGDIEVTRAQNRNFLLGDGFHRMARESNSFSLLLRYQAQAERHYRRAIEEFDRLKALREELPIEPITEPDLEPKKTTYPDPPTNPNSQSGISLQASQEGEQPQQTPQPERCCSPRGRRQIAQFKGGKRVRPTHFPDHGHGWLRGHSVVRVRGLRVSRRQNRGGTLKLGFDA